MKSWQSDETKELDEQARTFQKFRLDEKKVVNEKSKVTKNVNLLKAYN